MSAETKNQKVIAKWEWNYSAGIFENCRAIIRLYPDRAVYHYDGIRWIGNTGGCHRYHVRIEGAAHADLLALAAAEIEDESDYTEDAREIADRYTHGR